MGLGPLVAVNGAESMLNELAIIEHASPPGQGREELPALVVGAGGPAAIKDDWHNNYQFKKPKLNSFGDLLP